MSAAHKPSGYEMRTVLTALWTLLDHVDAETCVHEELHRGGTIWTICDGCGRKWADDEGGFVPHSDPPAVAKARAIIEATIAAETGAVGTPEGVDQK